MKYRQKMNKIVLTVTGEFEGARADRFISDKSDISRSYAVSLMENGNCLLNNKACEKNYKVKNQVWHQQER